MKYSIIVPVYNRPDEVDELLESLCTQTCKDFEVVIVEDGSATPCKEVCDKYAGKLDIHYYYKENTGPGLSRNYGAERANNEFLIILDSDAVVPPQYIEEVNKELAREDADAFGGPDAAHNSFTDVQKAISYSMTSFFTTGGIRGKKKQLDKFYPRSFNMGVRRKAYLDLGGFSTERFSRMALYGEDLDFSIRIYRAGLRCRLFPEAWVWHKRRTDMGKFRKQMYNSGIARINLYKRYPEALKLVHALPALFTVGVFALMLISIIGLIMMLCDSPQRWLWLFALPWLPVILYSLLLFIDSWRENRSLKIALLSVKAAFIQLMAYGCGFIEAWWIRCVKGDDGYYINKA